jgi:glycosyltransferase involved in cell wall biosynthesis
MSGKKIKLFVDAHSFDTEYQGTQTFIRELYSGLLNTHPDLDIYWGAYHTERVQAALPGVNPANLLPYKKSRGGLSRFIFDIPVYLKKHQFDFAHFQYLAPLKQGNCQYIVTLHDVLFNTFPADFSWTYRTSRNFLFGRSIKNAAIKTTVSDYSQQRIADDHRIAADDIHVIPNGVNPDITKYHQSKAGAAALVKEKFGIENFILYVSRIEPRKNHALLLEKYLKLELYKQNIALVFIGVESVHVARLQNAIQNLTPQQLALFFWLKDMQPAALAAFYTACRLFVYPSKAEGFGIPPLEAAVCGAPVLCSSATAMSSFDFFEPYTFDPENEAEFEEKLSLMLQHPPSTTYLSGVANHINEQYQWKNSSEKFYDLLVANQS